LSCRIICCYLGIFHRNAKIMKFFWASMSAVYGNTGDGANSAKPQVFTRNWPRHLRHSKLKSEFKVARVAERAFSRKSSSAHFSLRLCALCVSTFLSSACISVHERFPSFLFLSAQRTFAVSCQNSHPAVRRKTRKEAAS